MKTCLIITGGTLDLVFARSFLEMRSYDLVIAADAGLKAARSLGLVPQVAVGDFDTVDPGTLSYFRQIQGVAWEEHCAEKDETDTELALLTALEHGCQEIAILGALGGRMDHGLGNIHLLYAALLKGARACILDEKNKIYVLDQGREFCREDLWGKYISFLPLTQQVEGITLEGFQYPLHEKNIQLGTNLCISNQLAGEQGRLSFRTGVLVCVESHD